MDYIRKAGALALGSRLRRISDRLMLDGQQIYGSSSVAFEPRWFPVFYHLVHSGPCAITEIARGLGLSHAAVNQAVGGMSRAGLVAPYRDARDKRRRVIALTKEARQRQAAIEHIWQKLERVLEGLIDESGHDVLLVLQDLETVLAREGFYERYMKQQGQGDIRIVRFRDELASNFRQLNEEWITRLFGMEEADRRALSNPRSYIIEPGGEIIFAVDSDDEVLGTCALIRQDDAVCELAKMAVVPIAQGRGIGHRLGQEIVDVAREMGFMKMFLETNSSLAPALALYHALGFEQRPFPYRSEYNRADVYMELKL